jgi:hypothetical protein
MKNDINDIFIGLKSKRKQNNSNYDCIIGVSGGVDSLYVLHIASIYNLNPLVVHMDNCWNDELAVRNIYNIITKLGFDYISHVANAKFFDEELKSLIKANVVDLELLTDNLLLKVNYFYANKYGIKYIFGGMNFQTEGNLMPSNWNWFKFDSLNIISITKKILFRKNFTIGIFDYLYYKYISKIKWINLLDYVKYNKNEAINTLRENYEFTPYKYKHYESKLTRVYQSYILPVKFGIDKRKIHLSSLIVNGEISRDNALKILCEPPIPESELNSDIHYFLNKLNITRTEFDDYLKAAPVAHDKFLSYFKFIVFIKKYIF